MRCGRAETREAYVDLLYQTMFERSASENERAYWSGQIDVIGRSKVVDAIWFSHEAALYRAGGYYRTFLKREPDAAGQAYWAKILLSSGRGRRADRHRGQRGVPAARAQELPERRGDRSLSPELRCATAQVVGLRLAPRWTNPISRPPAWTASEEPSTSRCTSTPSPSATAAWTV